MDKFIIRTPKPLENDNKLSSRKHTSECPKTNEFENNISVKFTTVAETQTSSESSITGSSTTITAPDDRKFLHKWKETYKWLSFDESKNKAFCSVCSEAYNDLKIPLPCTGSNNDKVFQAFVQDGFDKWRNGITRFKSHEKTEVHRKASSSIISRKNMSVSNLISDQNLQSRRDSRICLIKIFDSIKYLAEQNVSIRGHTENRSNFIQLLKLRSKDTATLKSWMERSNYKWISHDIIDEILSLFSLKIQKKILSQIRRAPFYAVLADETTDVSRKEQMSANFRIVDDDMKIQEYFMGFYDTPKTDAETLYIIICDTLVRFELEMNKCRGQCYDGANNVSGEITGLQTRVRQDEPRALYTHCAGHNLSLSVQDAMKIIPEVADFLSNMKNLVTFCRASAKRNHIFKNIDFDDDEDDQGDENSEKFGSLKSFCPTRWTVRVKSLKSIKSNFKRILKVCEIVGQESTESGVKARGFTAYLEKFECLILLEISIATLETVEELNSTIQATTINFKSILKRLEILKTSLLALRSSEKFHKTWTATTSSAKTLGLDEPVLPRQRVAPKRFDPNSKTAYFPKTPEERYRVMYFGIIDQIISSLNTRFDSDSYKILSQMDDFATQKLEIETIKPLLVHDGKSDFDFDRLVLHRQMFFDFLSSQNIVLDDLTKISIFLQKNKEMREFCAEYTKFIKLLLTAPQTVCVAERSFSSLKLLKTYVCANLKQKKTNDLAMLYIHRDVADEIDLDDIVDEFISRTSVRKNTFALKNEM